MSYMSQTTRDSNRRATDMPRLVYFLILVAALVVAVAIFSGSPGSAGDRESGDALETTPASRPDSASSAAASLPSDPRDAPAMGPVSAEHVRERDLDARSPAPTTASVRDAEIERWRSQIGRRLTAFEGNSRDLDRVQELVLECILAQLELGLTFEEHAEGTRAPLSADGETQTVMRSGPSGTRSYSIRRNDYPLYFEVVKYFDPAYPGVALVPHNSVPEALSARAKQFATDVLERLQ